MLSTLALNIDVPKNERKNADGLSESDAIEEVFCHGGGPGGG